MALPYPCRNSSYCVQMPLTPLTKNHFLPVDVQLYGQGAEPQDRGQVWLTFHQYNFKSQTEHLFSLL